MTTRTLVLIVVSLVAHVAAAQSNETSTAGSAVDDARVHFDRGVELYRESNFDAALAEFQRANQIAPNYKILYNIAQVQAERHEYVVAVQLLNEYLQTGGSAVSSERRQSVTEDIEKLQQRIATLIVSVSVEGAEVFVNDVSVGRSPLSGPVLVNVGSCRVRAEKAGYATQAQTITVAGTDRPRVELKLAPVTSLMVQRAVPETTISRRDMTPFWISLGVTAALGGATAVFGVLTHGADHDLDHALNQFPAQRNTIDSARHKLRTAAALTDGFGAGMIVAAGTALYFLIAPPEHTEVVPAAGVQARISPSPSGLAVSGTF